MIVETNNSFQENFAFSQVKLKINLDQYGTDNNERYKVWTQRKSNAMLLFDDQVIIPCELKRELK